MCYLGSSGHILTTIPAGQGYEIADAESGHHEDMVAVVQHQIVHMPRSEAYRLGYIHANTIG